MPCLVSPLMAQLQQLEFTAVELELAARFTDQGRRLVATPAARDRFLLHDGQELPWGRIEQLCPVRPLEWWANLKGNQAIAQAHIWLGAKGFIVSGSCSMGRLFVVGEHETSLPPHPIVEFLAEERHRDLRNVLVHLDLFTA